MAKLTIKRSEWYRGNGCAMSRLVLQDVEENKNDKCCLGIYCIALGVPREELIDIATPSKAYERINKAHKVKLSCMLEHVDDNCPIPSAVVRQLMRINDNVYITEEQRADRIKEGFRQITDPRDGQPVEVEFVD